MKFEYRSRIGYPNQEVFLGVPGIQVEAGQPTKARLLIIQLCCVYHTVGQVHSLSQKLGSRFCFIRNVLLCTNTFDMLELFTQVPLFASHLLGQV
jgi:hypothetical protein